MKQFSRGTDRQSMAAKLTDGLLTSVRLGSLGLLLLISGCPGGPNAMPATRILTVDSSNPASGVAITGDVPGTTPYAQKLSVDLSHTNRTVTAPAIAPNGNAFINWDNCNSTNGSSCTVDLRIAGQTVTANYGPPSPQPPTLTSISPNVGVPDPNPVHVTLTGTNFTSPATVDVKTLAGAAAPITIAAGSLSIVSTSQITADFVIPSSTTAGPYNVTVTTAQGTTGPQTFTVGSASTFLFVQALAFAPNPVAGGQASVGTVTMNTAVPAGGIDVDLLSSNPTAVTVPTTVNIPAGATGATFTATTATVTAATVIDVTASLGGAPGMTTSLTVNPPSASKLSFTAQPSNTAPRGTITPAVQVAIQDTAGTTDTTATNPVTLSIGTNPASGILSGTLTVNAVAGVATFSNLSIDKAGTGYTLNAVSAGLTGTISSAFNVNAAAPSIILAPGNIPSIDDAGDTAVVIDQRTTAYVFVKDGAGHWAQATQLTNPDATAASVSISGDGTTAVIGSCTIATCVGHAFVYAKPAGGWSTSSTMSPTATLSASDGLTGDRIGLSIATNQTGTTVAVGAPCGVSIPTPVCGSVYVFVRPSGGWTSANQNAKLTAGSVINLGFSVALNAAGDEIAAGATSIRSTDPGAVYVFQKPAGIWADTSTPVGTLIASDGASGANLGASVSMSSDGGTVVAGASISTYPDLTTGSNGPGAAYVFIKPAGGWNPLTAKHEDAKLTASDRMPSDFFGASVSISGDGSTVVSGASRNPYVSATNTPGPGAAYIFARPSGGWAGPQTETQKLLSFPGTDINGDPVTPAGGFGGAVAIARISGTIAVGGSSTPTAPSARGVIFIF